MRATTIVDMGAAIHLYWLGIETLSIETQPYILLLFTVDGY